MRGGLIVVRAGVGWWVEAYDNLDFLVLLHQGKRTKKKGNKCDLSAKEFKNV